MDLSKKTRKIIKIAEITMIGFLIIFIIVSMVIAKNVVSSMADVRVEKNEATLEQFGLEGEQINVTNSDGLNINAYIVENEASKGNVIILHGMHGVDATSLFDYGKFIYDEGYTPVLVDMRAHGKSDGESLSFGYLEIFDVVAVIEYLKEEPGFKDKPIILYGLSMGGSTAINTAAASVDVDGVIAVSPFLSIQHQVADFMKNDGAPSPFIQVFKPFVQFVLWNKFDVSPVKDSPQNTVSNIDNIPIFIIHGDQDSQTDVYHGETLFDLCSSNDKELWVVEGKDHLIEEDVLANSSEYYRQRISQFLDEKF